MTMMSYLFLSVSFFSALVFGDIIEYKLHYSDAESRKCDGFVTNVNSSCSKKKIGDWYVKLSFASGKNASVHYFKDSDCSQLDGQEYLSVEGSCSPLNEKSKMLIGDEDCNSHSLPLNNECHLIKSDGFWCWNDCYVHVKADNTKCNSDGTVMLNVWSNRFQFSGCNTKPDHSIQLQKDCQNLGINREKLKNFRGSASCDIEKAHGRLVKNVITTTTTPSQITTTHKAETTKTTKVSETKTTTTLTATPFKSNTSTTIERNVIVYYGEESGSCDANKVELFGNDCSDKAVGNYFVKAADKYKGSNLKYAINLEFYNKSMCRDYVGTLPISSNFDKCTELRPQGLDVELSAGFGLCDVHFKPSDGCQRVGTYNCLMNLKTCYVFAKARYPQCNEKDEFILDIWTNKFESTGCSGSQDQSVTLTPVCQPLSLKDQLAQFSGSVKCQKKVPFGVVSQSLVPATHPQPKPFFLHYGRTSDSLCGSDRLNMTVGKCSSSRVGPWYLKRTSARSLSDIYFFKDEKCTEIVGSMKMNENTKKCTQLRPSGELPTTIKHGARCELASVVTPNPNPKDRSVCVLIGSKMTYFPFPKRTTYFIKLQSDQCDSSGTITGDVYDNSDCSGGSKIQNVKITKDCSPLNGKITSSDTSFVDFQVSVHCGFESIFGSISSQAEYFPKTDESTSLISSKSPRVRTLIQVSYLTIISILMLI